MGLDRFRDISGRGGGVPPRRRFPGGNGGSGDQDPIGRIPPHSIEAEMAVLGAMLLGDRAAVERGLELVSRDDFYRDAHGSIFDAMASLNGKGEPIDIITLRNEMTLLGTLDGVGVEYLLQLSNVEFTTSNIAYYAQIVAEKAVLRRLIEAASQIAGTAYGETEEVSDLVDRAERLIFEVARKRSGQGFTPLRPLLTEVFEKLDTVYQDKGIVTGVDTGYVDLNAMTSGLQEGDLFILAARPSMGKTSLAMGIGQNACLPHHGARSVAVFSLEMSKEQLVQRLICSEARVDAHRMRTGYLQDSDWDRISAAVQRLWDARLFIDDTTEMSALEMRARCRRLQAEYGLDLVIVDYLQLMRGTGRNDANRNEEITTIARGLKGLARELRVPVIALSQLSRAVERREDKRPMLSDLRESGAIEAEADLVAFIYRPAYYERKQEFSKEAQDAPDPPPGSDDYSGEEAEIIIAKHRNGPTGTVKLAFLPKFARFDNLAENRESSF
ncbi:MAG: replicative DNA helicase [Capsulimonadales bacterium]|nr:replicative DNA helicase [Capsulimonadales bacterium]